MGAGGGQGGVHIPKAQGLKRAVGVRNRATGKTLEGADRQTDRDRQTDFSFIRVRWPPVSW